MQQILHRHEHAVVIGRRRKDKVAASECRRENMVCGDDRGVKHTHRHSALAELCGEDVRSVLRVAVHRCIRQHDALFLRCIAAPELVLLKIRPEILAPHEAVQRADIGDLQRRGLLQHRLHLHAVLADDVGVIAPRFIKELGHEVAFVRKELAVERTEGAERVRREKYLIRQVVGHHYLRPVHHRRHDEGQLVAACLKGVALLDDVHPRAEIVAAEKLRYHRPYLVVAYHARLRVAL